MKGRRVIVIEVGLKVDRQGIKSSRVWLKCTYKRMKDGYGEHRINNEWHSGVVVSMEICANQGVTLNLKTIVCMQTL